MDYSVHMQARSEYERRVRSIPPVPEYGQPLIERKSSGRQLPMWLLRPILTVLSHFVIT